MSGRLICLRQHILIFIVQSFIFVNTHGTKQRRSDNYFITRNYFPFKFKFSFIQLSLFSNVTHRQKYSPKHEEEP